MAKWLLRDALAVIATAVLALVMVWLLALIGPPTITRTPPPTSSTRLIAAPGSG